MSSLSDSPDLCVTIMEDAVTSWGQRLEGVVRQEVERCAEVTEWAREALRHAAASGGKPRPRDTRPSSISRVLCRRGQEGRGDGVLALPAGGHHGLHQGLDRVC